MCARGCALVVWVGVVVACVCVGGCGTTQRERELARVAKDWAQTIRASQVIPVYPLTEDLLPGDVFLVTTSVHKQAEEYRTRGFLSLDMHKARLKGLDYSGFYHQSRGIGARKDTPYHWIYPEPSGDPAGSRLPATPPEIRRDDEARHTMPTAFWQAPHAFFPSYSFEVSSRLGINAAIPIQSVPISLAFMDTREATGSVQLTDAFVYGVSETELRETLEVWATEHRASLIEMRAANSGPVFLRVVNRVYLVGAVNVSLRSARSGNANAEVGERVPSPEGAETPGKMRVADVAALRTLSEVASAGMPGGAVSYSYASSRQVVANETFARPLVVGFLALDYPVLGDGSLGAAVASSKTLVGEPLRQGQGGATSGDRFVQESALYRSAIEGLAADDRNDLYERAVAQMPRAFREVYQSGIDGGRDPSDAFANAEGVYTGGRESEWRRREVLRAMKRAWEE